MRRKVLFACLLFLSVQPLLHAQFPGASAIAGMMVERNEALDRALTTTALTHGKQPFHAVLAIGATGEAYSGRLEVWWADTQHYKTVLASPAFSQTRIVDGKTQMESNTGDYYPRWLQNFVDGLLDPIPMIENFRGKGGVMLSPAITRSCLKRDDRPSGVTDQLTWGEVCFSGDKPLLLSVLAMNYDIVFADWKSFHGQQIARAYTTDVLSYKEVAGRLTTLEDLKNPPANLFAVTVPAPPAQQIQTQFVSTLKEESMLEDAPKIEWPTVREGRTDGYMIVYARTDRTGQVRETAKHNSDQPGLESFGMEQALHYKFKPLLVDGVAVQMEMPLVLHFTSKIAEPLPTLHGAELLKQIGGCKARLVDAIPSGKTVIHISINEQGKLTGEGFGPRFDPGLPAVLIEDSLRNCRFAPLMQNGVVTYYHGDLYGQGMSMDIR